jgi:serine/threonine-protein kinase
MSSVELSLDQPRPEKVGPYLILDELGSGGMGTVYLGRHAETQRVAAVKMLPPALAREGGFRLRFAREIEALATVTNPHIVKLYDNGEDHGTVYYAMEYVAGETLTQRLRRERRLLWRDAVAITLQLCSALKAAHDAGIIHRDLKPSNTMLAVDGAVKLTDFGIAQVFAAEKLTSTGGIVGTAEYMSPEQAKGQRATKRSDLYSLGALFYVMLTGRPPFTGQTSVDILQKHQFGQFDLPSRYVPEIPSAIDDIVKQLLEKDPDKRIPDAFVLSRRLQDVLQRQEQKLSEQMTTADPSRVPLPGELPHEHADATLMRDLVRHEIARQHAPSELSRWTDNLWVLLGLFGLVVGGLWWMLNRSPDDAARFAEAAAVLEGEPGPEWSRVRTELLEPLVTRDATTWGDRASPLLERIAVYELEQQLLATRRGGRKREPPSEIERQLAIVRKLWDGGELPTAAQKLAAIQRLWAAEPTAQEALRVAEKWAQELADQSRQLADPSPWIEQQLSAVDQAEAPRARDILSALIELYTDDPRVAPLVEQARLRLKTLGAESP